MDIEDTHTSSRRSSRSGLLLWIEGSGVPFVAADSIGFVIFKVVLSVWGSGNSYTGLPGCFDCKDTEQKGNNKYVAAQQAAPWQQRCLAVTSPPPLLTPIVCDSQDICRAP